MVTVDPNTGLFDKVMFLEQGAIGIYTPTEDGEVFKRERLYLAGTMDMTNIQNKAVACELTKREVEALIENLQQVIAMGMLDE